MGKAQLLLPISSTETKEKSYNSIRAYKAQISFALYKLVSVTYNP
jgi:hypothetical protein